MTFGDWISEPTNWAFLVMAIPLVLAAWRVVTSRNVVHAALSLVFALAASAGLFILLGAEFVAWVLVLVYIGAVIVLFLFGIMITRAPIGMEAELSHAKRWPAALAALSIFTTTSWLSVDAFGTTEIVDVGVPTSTEVLGRGLLGQFVLPFEAVGFLLLAALIGGVTLARRDDNPAEEEARLAAEETEAKP